MKEKMVHRFRKTAAHIAPIRQREAPEHQIIQISIQPWAAVHKKKATLLGTLTFQVPFQGKLQRDVPLILL